jgi:hypothetical protein
MAPERAEIAGPKAMIYRAPANAVDALKLHCEALVEDLGVAIDDFTALGLDAFVNCGDPVAADALLAPAPDVVAFVRQGPIALDSPGVSIDILEILPSADIV